MKNLVIVAHPDDEILGMGGTILKHRQEGDLVRIIILATGITSRRKSNNKNSFKYPSKENSTEIENEIIQLREDAKNAGNVLKTNDIIFHNFPDNEMDSIPLLEITKIIEKEIDKFKPDRVYTHHYNDLNVDHRIVYNATLTACRPINFKVKELYSFEVLSSTEWNYPIRFQPNIFVNISKQLEKKLKAMSMYKNEIRKFPHPRSLENMKNVASRWGSIMGSNYAEAFELIRKLES
jgi:N-acetylglucosamine malate deacetylase 1|tara:strand:+ start:10966 stop:11673 length:708 start_codon:yes stop_codon:yes gene_type:complete